MSIQVGDNFSYQGTKPLDGRIKYDTLADMKAVADAVIYEGCIAYCVATAKTYQWKSTNTVDADTGKWREFETGGGSSLPSGGTTNQALVKKSNNDGDVKWSSVDAVVDNEVRSNVSVGAISAGGIVFQGTSFSNFVEQLLIAEKAPPFIFKINKSGDVLYGESYTETLTLEAIDLGTAKSITNIKYYANDVLLFEDENQYTTGGGWAYDMVEPTTDTTIFKIVATYQDSNYAIKTATLTKSLNFYYNKFYGVVSSPAPDEATVEALTAELGSSIEETSDFTTIAQYVCYAYPKSLGTLTSIKDQNGFELIDSFTMTEVTYTQNGTSVDYYRYVLTDPATVSNYTITFS